MKKAFKKIFGDSSTWLFVIIVCALSFIFGGNAYLQGDRSQGVIVILAGPVFVFLVLFIYWVALTIKNRNSDKVEF